MSQPLLETKLAPPRLQASIPRPRLLNKLDQVWNHPLTLVSAPAGFGKSTLLRQWLEHQSDSLAWLSLDPEDDSPHRFLAYLMAAFSRANPALVASSLQPAQARYFPDLRAIFATLINQIATLDQPLAIVLDDFQSIVNTAILDGIDFLIERAPAQLHLVIASRIPPQLSLPRYRARRELLELGTSDLRFTAVEVDAFLSEIMGLDLAPEQRASLEAVTEGWIAGLHLAGLSLQRQPHPAGALTALAQAGEFASEFLLQEVLNQQDPDTRRFLLLTSLPDSFNAELAETLVDRGNAHILLRKIAASNLFLQAVDDRNQWYRYHQLFRDLLRHQLEETESARLPQLHRQLSQWYERHGLLSNAIQHACLGGAFERAAGLLEQRFGEPGWINQNMAKLLDWLEILPDSVLQPRPQLMLDYAWLLLEVHADRWQGIERLLGLVEAGLAADPPREAGETAGMRAQVDLLRGNHARATGDHAQALQHSKRALQRLSPDERFVRSGALAHVGAAHAALGEYSKAYEVLRVSVSLASSAGNHNGQLFAAGLLIDVCIGQLRLHEAESLRADLMHRSGPDRTGPDFGHVLLTAAQSSYCQNRLDEAESAVRRGLLLCLPFRAWHDSVVMGQSLLARIQAARSLDQPALQTLAEARLRANSRTSPRLARLTARIKWQLGDLKAAQRWLKQHPIGLTEDLGFQQLPELLTSLRAFIVLLEEKSVPILRNEEHLSPEDIGSHLDRILEVCDRKGWTKRWLETCVLRTRLHQLQGEADQAIQALSRAVSTAYPENALRPFLNHGKVVLSLLSRLSTSPAHSEHARAAKLILTALPASSETEPTWTPDFVEALTERELETLKLLATDLSIQEIADQLVVTISTVRTYTKRIYSKLDVHSRAEAVYRARALGLI